MPIRVTLSCILSDIWGADEAYAAGGAMAVRELINEDLSAFVEECGVKVEKIPADVAPQE